MRKLLIIFLLLPFISKAQFPLPSNFGFTKPQSSLITYLYDTFTDANGTALQSHTMNIGSGWTRQSTGLCSGNSGYTIQSNTASSALSVLQIYTAEAGVSDCVASIDAIVPNTSNYVGGLIFRYTDCANWWTVAIERDAGGTPYMHIYESQAGVRQTRASVNVTGATNTTLNIKVTLSGNSIVALAGTGETCSYSSSFNASATKFGVLGYYDATYSTVIPLDNFLVTNQ